MKFRAQRTPQRQTPRRLLVTLAAICLPVFAAAFFSGSFFRVGTLGAGEVLNVASAHAASSHGADVPGAVVNVNIQTYAYQPQNVTINAGDTVRWTNLDSDRHTVTADNGAFSSPEFDQNQTYQFTFNTPGTYTYYCARHTAMRGTITVVGAGPTGTTTTTPGATGTGTAGTTTTTTPGATGTGTPGSTTTGTPQPGCNPTGYISISITDSSFVPSTVTVSPGTQVTWTNNGTRRHRVRDINHVLFDSDDLMPGQSFSYTFCNPGTYQYEDSRDGFNGTIIVSGTPGPTTTPGGTTTGTPGTTTTTTPGGTTTGTPGTTTTPGSGRVDIRIVCDNAGCFVPGSITIQSGTIVRWINEDGDDHTATSPGNFDSGVIPEGGGTWETTLVNNGTYNYFCAIHTEMTGSITVVGGPTSTPAVSPTAGTGMVDVDIQQYSFRPQNVVVVLGTTVRWTNRDPDNHTATADNGLFNSGNLGQNQTYQYTFNTLGTFGYYCAIHPGMRGSITVTDGSTTPTPQVTQTAQTTQTAQVTQTAQATGTTTPGATGTASATVGAGTPSATAGVGTATSTMVPGQHFTDVVPTDYFYVPVNWLVERGIISGYSDNTFRPYNNATRGQITKIVVLGEGWTVINPATPTFTDVLTDHPFYNYIETAVQHNIISGYADETFRPYNNVTRGQLTKIVVLARTWALVTPATPTFTDVQADNAFYSHIETAVQHGIISGYADGTFRPGNNATRGQIAKIVYMALQD